MKRDARDAPKNVTLGFEDDRVTLPIDAILPLRTLGKNAKSSRKYRQIVASIAQIGIVEPPVVVRNPDKSATWLLLDGHLRIEALKDAAAQEVECLVSTDDEAFTYNRQVSRLAPILKDKPCTNAVFETLRKMKTMRQIEAAELLVNANNYSVAYVNAILAGTPQAQLVESSKPKKVKGITPEAMARMEQELARLQEGIASIQDTYGQDHLHLTVIKGYVGRLLGNARIVRYLAQNHPEFLGEFQTITEITPVEAATPD